jgi:signal transduction histidine kinase/ActR/RegA family two-component response regulator
MNHPSEGLQRAQETIRQLYAEIEQTNKEVMALTLELEQRVDALRKEVAERKKAESERQAQVDRLKLLNQITRAIGERQDLRSILQVTVRSLEDHLLLDFGYACVWEPAESALTVASSLGEQQAAQWVAEEDRLLQGDASDLVRSLRGEFLYEPDAERNPAQLPQRLAKRGLHALVVVPLRAESKVSGALVAARRGTDSFSIDEREFIRQLSEHVALAAHQAMLHGALEHAYEDMRRTQQAVMQQERLRALGQLAGGIAHDINNALSPAAIYVQTLLDRDPSLSSEAREYLTVINRAIDDVGHTVARMRMFYRPREPELTLSSLDLNRLLSEVVELTRARWSAIPQERGISVRLESSLAPQLPAVMGAENEIRDALTNLLLNAVDAMPAGGTLTLRSGVCGPEQGAPSTNLDSFVFVEVRDTGIGMSEEVRNRCLEPFFTTKGERGTGLGLAMVYGMVQRHSAEMEIDSVPGQGTAMRLIFPAATQSEVRQPPTPARPVSSLRILLVDDDPLVLRSLRDVLQSEGHSVTTADGGQNGIEQFLAARTRGEPFAVVISDLGMPNVNGRAVAAAVKSAGLGVPVILLTGWGQRLNEERELPEHVDRVLGKPPRLSELRSALAELVAAAPPGEAVGT